MRAVVIILVMLMGYAVEARTFELKPVDDEHFCRLAQKHFGVEDLRLETLEQSRIGWTTNGYPVVLTGDYVAPRGYRGPTSVMLLMSPGYNQILNACLVESCDSPQYVRRAVKKGLISNLKTKESGENGLFEVDAVSGATRTSDAVEKAVNETVSALK